MQRPFLKLVTLSACLLGASLTWAGGLSWESVGDWPLWCRPMQMRSPTDPLPWTAWDSPEGRERFARHQHEGRVWRLLRYYETQVHLNYCGVATAVNLLNGLGLQPASSETYGAYRLFNQQEFFNRSNRDLATARQVSRTGIGLELMQKLLERAGAQAVAYSADGYSAADLKRCMIEALQSSDQEVVVLYGRAVLKQQGKGHWAPVAAYDDKTDSFLLLDVAKYKHPPVWVDADTLIQAIQTRDLKGRARGLIVAKKAPSPASGAADRRLS